MVFENIKMCTGCGMCVSVCPTKCISMELNNDGFYIPVLNSNGGCVKCGLCIRICPQYITVEEKQPSSILSAVSKDETTLATTSSGGLCYEIAKKALQDGKKVCACVYNYEEHRAEHVVVESEQELEATKGSKYFQSYTPKAFSKLFDGSEWVVFGSPCQIAAVDKAAVSKNVRDKFLLVDFFCHGTPSMNMWKKYISEKDGEKIKKIEFRSKEFGWHKFSLRFTYEDGSEKSDFECNMFYKFFFNNLILNSSCYACHFKALKSCADIRVGDYWGEKYRDNTKGVSCCIPFTERGKNAAVALSESCVFVPEEEEAMLKEQMKTSPPLRKERKKLLKVLRGKKTLKQIHESDLFLYRLKCKVKIMLGVKK